jgi:FKBP-type peptidyl-prolyl cis-trans isomerase FklB
MKKSLIILISGLFIYGCCKPQKDEKAKNAKALKDSKQVQTITTAIPAASVKKADLKTEIQKVSYIIGNSIGSRFKQRGENIDVSKFIAGFKNSMTGIPNPFSKMEERQIMTGFQKKMNGKMNKKRMASGAINEKAGAAFLAANKTKPGIITTASGLQYKIIKAGTGAIPTKTDKVKCHYKGTLIGGKEFDSSYKRKKPATFGVTGVIKGWTEALQLMKAGAKWQLFIPGKLAYGIRGNRGIEPNTTLIFDIELLEIIPGTTPGTTPIKIDPKKVIIKKIPGKKADLKKVPVKKTAPVKKTK